MAQPNPNVRPGMSVGGVRPNPAPPANLSTILGNLPNLFQLEAKGELSQTQLTQLRTLIHTQAPRIVLNSLVNKRPNPLFSLPASLDPTHETSSSPALCTKEQWQSTIQNATNAATNAANKALSAPSQQGANAGNAVRPNGGRQGTSGGNTPGGIVRPTQGGQGFQPVSEKQLKLLRDMPEADRIAYLSNNPDFRARLDATMSAQRQANARLQQRHQANNGSGGSSTPNPSNAPSNVRPQAQQPNPFQTPRPGPSGQPSGSPSTPVQVGGVSTSANQFQNSSTIAATSTPPQNSQQPNANAFSTPANQITGSTLPRPYYQPPPNALPPRQIPVESEPSRRKRKLREYVKELAPELEVDLDIEPVIDELLDNFLIEVAQSSCRLAKHRGSDKVELKDVALELEKHWDISVPAFNARVPKRVHTAPEEGKRLRTVVPIRRGGGRGNKEDE